MTTIIFVVIALLVLVTLGRVLRNGNIREKYAFLWVLVGVALGGLALAWSGKSHNASNLSNLAIGSLVLTMLGIHLGRQRWGDYSQVSLDPNDNGRFYAIGQAAASTPGASVHKA